MLPALLERTLLGRDDAAALALDQWASGAALPDEAPALDGARVDLETVLAAFAPSPTAADTTALWRDEARVLGEALSRALASPGARRLRALRALDARDDGPGLAPLAASGAAPLPPATAAAVRDVAAHAREAVAKLLDDADPLTAASALRILGKLDDPRVTPRRVARAATGPSPARAAARSVARRMASSPATARALTEALAVALASADADERLGLVEVLATLGEPAIAPLERAASDRSPLVRAAVARALAARPGAHGGQTLERLSSDESAAVRRAALTRSPALDLSPSPTTMGR
jgi:hypothetical protein